MTGSRASYSAPPTKSTATCPRTAAPIVAVAPSASTTPEGVELHAPALGGVGHVGEGDHHHELRQEEHGLGEDQPSGVQAADLFAEQAAGQDHVGVGQGEEGEQRVAVVHDLDQQPRRRRRSASMWIAFGQPVMVKASYYPNWTVSGANGPFRATPNFMVVVPTEKHVTLEYGTTKAEWFGRYLTLSGLVGVGVLRGVGPTPEAIGCGKYDSWFVRRLILPNLPGGIRADPGLTPGIPSGTDFRYEPRAACRVARRDLQGLRHPRASIPTRSTSRSPARRQRVRRVHRRGPGARRPRHAAVVGAARRRLRRRRLPSPAPTSSTSASLHRPRLLRLRQPRRARRDVHRQPQPGAVQRHQAVPGRRRAGRRGDRPRPDQGVVAAGLLDRGEEPGRVERRDLLDPLRRARALVRRPRRAAAAAVVADTANGVGGLDRARGLRRPAVRPHVLFARARRHLPEPPGRPDPAREPEGSPARSRSTRARRRRTRVRRRRRPRLPRRRSGRSRVSGSTTTAILAQAILGRHPGGKVVHNLICSKAVPEVIRESGGTPIRSRVGHSFIKQVMAETGAVFGGEHSAHYYFRDNCRADSGSSRRSSCSSSCRSRACRSPSCASRSSATPRRARSTHASTTRRRHRAGRGRVRRREAGPPRRAHRRLRRLVVQPAAEQHRAVAAAEPRSRRRRRVRGAHRRGARAHRRRGRLMSLPSLRCDPERNSGGRTVALDPKLLEILACPEDKGPLLYFDDEVIAVQPAPAARYAVRTTSRSC